MESVNSSIAINVRSSPAIRLPLLSSRVITRRFFAAERRAGRDVRSTLSELQAAHPHAVSWAHAGGEARRFETPSPPFTSPTSHEEDNVGGVRGLKEAFGPQAAEAGAILAAWLSMCPESRSPTVDFAIGFGTLAGQSGGQDKSGGVGEGLQQVTWRSLWFPVLRYYSQIWVVRVLDTGKVSLPLEHRKLLAVVETELGNRVAEASSWPSGAMISRKDSLLGLTTGCWDRGPSVSTALIASALAEACRRQGGLLGWPPLFDVGQPTR